MATFTAMSGKEDTKISPPAKVMEWIGDARKGYLRLLDQTKLPEKLEFLECRDALAVWDAIRRLVVRGAPAIGVAAGYGMVVAAEYIPDGDFMTGVEAAAEYQIGRASCRERVCVGV